MKLLSAEDLKTDLIQKLGYSTHRYTADELFDEMIKIIDEQPTAYDLDEVIKSMLKIEERTEGDTLMQKSATRMWNKAVHKCVNTVKGGVK